MNSGIHKPGVQSNPKGGIIAIYIAQCTIYIVPL